MSMLLIMLVILGTFITSSWAITCYSCNSFTAPCRDPFTATMTSNVTCPSGVCHKLKYESNRGRLLSFAFYYLRFTAIYSAEQMFLVACVSAHAKYEKIRNGCDMVWISVLVNPRSDWIFVTCDLGRWLCELFSYFSSKKIEHINSKTAGRILLQFSAITYRYYSGFCESL